MSDRELLELAALAAGLIVKEERSGGLHWTVRDSNGLLKPWQPLDDDGDALRLAVKLGLTINPYKRGVFVSRSEGEPVIREEWGDDDAATTRRAIVRAAAEIGKAMQARQQAGRG